MKGVDEVAKAARAERGPAGPGKTRLYSWGNPSASGPRQERVTKKDGSYGKMDTIKKRTEKADLVREDRRPFGFNVEAPKYGDPVWKGEIGPSKVAGFALQNVAKAASYFPAPEVRIAPIQSKDLDSHAICGASSGGMGDM